MGVEPNLASLYFQRGEQLDMDDHELDSQEYDSCVNDGEHADPVAIPIDGVLDLHTFAAREVPDLLEDYLAACREAHIVDVRIIHGKGKGILRDRVRAILGKHPWVLSISTAPLEAGGWGATLVRLRDKPGDEM